MTKRAVIFLAVLALVLGALAVWAQTSAAKPAPPPPQGQQAPPSAGAVPQGKVRIEGTLANTGGRFFLGGWFGMNIDRWSTPEEGREMYQILAQGGEQKLLDKVWKMKQIGDMTVEGSMGKPIFYAICQPVPGGIVIRALTNAPLSAWGARSQDFPFGVAEIVIPTGEKGHGVVIGMARIGFTPTGATQVEGYGTIPVKLMDVTIKVK
jgi:hypothetical protein